MIKRIFIQDAKILCGLSNLKVHEALWLLIHDFDWEKNKPFYKTSRKRGSPAVLISGDADFPWEFTKIEASLFGDIYLDNRNKNVDVDVDPDPHTVIPQELFFNWVKKNEDFISRFRKRFSNDPSIPTIPKILKEKIEETEKELFQKNKIEEREKFFPVEPGTKWKDVTFNLVNEYAVKIILNGKSKKFSYQELGMVNQRNRNPTQVWWALTALILESRFDKKTVDRMSKLNIFLKNLFGISENIAHFNKSERRHIPVFHATHSFNTGQPIVKTPKIKNNPDDY